MEDTTRRARIEDEDKKVHHVGPGRLGLFLSFLGPVNVNKKNPRLHNCRLYTTEKTKRRLRSAFFITILSILATSIMNTLYVSFSTREKNQQPTTPQASPLDANGNNANNSPRGGASRSDRQLLDEALTTCKNEMNQAKASLTAEKEKLQKQVQQLQQEQAEAKALVAGGDTKPVSSSSAETTAITPLHVATSSSSSSSSSSNSNDAIQMADFEEGALGLTILPNELPGYTGWARPVRTVVDYFRVIGFSAPHATVGQNWSVELECHHEACSEGKSLFYVRAFGRSLLPGRVVDHENGKYTVTILPHDAGRYTLEVVLTCSQRPDWTNLPVKGTPGEPSYEGYLVPGFPLLFTVKPVSTTAADAEAEEDAENLAAQGKDQALHEQEEQPAAVQEERRRRRRRRLKEAQQPLPLKQQSQPKQRSGTASASASTTGGRRPLCSAKQLIETSVDSAVETGRWLVVNKTRALPFTPHKEIKSYISTEQITLDTYMSGHSSVGFQMDYFPLDCDLISLEDVANPDTWLNVMNKRARLHDRVIHILYIGDSNTRNQYNFFRKHIASPTNYLDGRMNLTYVDMMGHWPDTFPKTKTTIEEIMSTHKDDIFFSVFNVGLHEVTNRCTLQGIRKRLKIEGRCHKMYQKDVKELLDLVMHSMKSSMLNVWQSSTAGWPKWGVYGIAWPQNAGQKVPKEPNFCAYMNELAWDIIAEAKIPVMDTFWLSVSRADHREVVKDDKIRTSYKLVHLGPEVYSVLVRKFSMMILEALEKGTLGQRYIL